MLKLAMEESIKDQQRTKVATSNQLDGMNIDEALMQTIMALSTTEQVDFTHMSAGVKNALSNGFTLE